jgi:hypothetical protein
MYPIRQALKVLRDYLQHKNHGNAQVAMYSLKDTYGEVGKKAIALMADVARDTDNVWLCETALNRMEVMLKEKPLGAQTVVTAMAAVLNNDYQDPFGYHPEILRDKKARVQEKALNITSLVLTRNPEFARAENLSEGLTQYIKKFKGSNQPEVETREFANWQKAAKLAKEVDKIISFGLNKTAPVRHDPSISLGKTHLRDYIS